MNDEIKGIFWFDKDGKREYIVTTDIENQKDIKTKIEMVKLVAGKSHVSLYFRGQRMNCRSHDDGTIELYPAIPDKRYMVYRKKGH